MEIFTTLGIKILPLYFFIALGFIATKTLKISQEAIGKLLLYIFYPAVVFLATLQAGLDLNLLALPFFFALTSTLFCLVSKFFAKKIWHDGTQNLVAYLAGVTNAGYFGIPVVLSIFGDSALKIAVMVNMGFALFESTVGFYTMARSRHSVRQAFLRLLKLPSLYAFLAAIACNLLHITLPELLFGTLDSLKAAFVPLGMMMIGLGLAAVNFRRDWDWKFMGFVLTNKFLIWPIVFGLLLWVDAHSWHFFSPLMQRVIFLQSITPVAANSIIFSTEFRLHPEKMALTVVISVLFALVFIPVMAALFF